MIILYAVKIEKQRRWNLEERENEQGDRREDRNQNS